jgi:hypothetical protein
VPRLRYIRDAHTITRRFVDASNHARRRDEQPKFAMDRTIADHAMGGLWRNDGMDCDNIAGSKQLRIGRLTRPLA